MKLIIINGPWGVGKSTLAAQLHADMPRSVHVEIDVLRKSICGYDDSPEENFRFVIRLASDIIQRCLEEGRDVIVDKMLRANDLLDDIRQAGDRHGADVFELMLWASLETVLERGSRRGYSAGVFSREKAIEAWEQSEKIMGERKDAVVVDTENKTPEKVYEIIKQKIAA